MGEGRFFCGRKPRGLSFFMCFFKRPRAPWRMAYASRHAMTLSASKLIRSITNFKKPLRQTERFFVFSASARFVTFHTAGATHKDTLARENPQSLPPLCKGRWHFRKKMTEGLFSLSLFHSHAITRAWASPAESSNGTPSGEKSRENPAPLTRVFSPSRDSVCTSPAVGKSAKRAA